MTNFSERTNTLLYKNIISHTLFSKGWWLLCVRDELETGTDCYIDPAVLLSHLGLVDQPWVTEGPKPSVCRWFLSWHLIPNWLKPSVCWLYYCLTSTCFRCSSAYLHRCISWLTTQLRVTMLHSSLRGSSPQALTLLRGVGFIAWRLRLLSLGECQQGPRHFWNCRTRLGYGPAPGPT